MLFKDYYKILGISRDASLEEIKKVYRKKSMEYHPDRNGDKSDEELALMVKRQQLINEAFDALGGKTQDLEVKRKYDEMYDVHYFLAEQNARSAQRRVQTKYEEKPSSQSKTQEQSTTQTTQENQTKKQEEERAAKERARRGFWQYNAGGPGFDHQTFDRKTTKDFDFNSYAHTVDYDVYSDEEEVVEETKQESPFISSIKQAWKEVREEEKRESFKERHANIDRNLQRKDKAARTKRYRTHDEFGNEEIIRHTRPRTQTEDIVFKIKSGTIHIACETLVQLEKLTHINEDSVPKFILRNRNILAATLVACIIAAGPTNAKQPEIPDNITSYSASTPQPLPTEDLNIVEDIIMSDEDREMEERINREYIAYRTYRIQSNDTLTQIAGIANCTISEIERENNLSDSNLIKVGETIIVPYHIESGDLMYATFSAYCPEGSSLEEFAKMYSTDVRTITALNGEAIVDGVALTDSLLVPNFATQAEIAAKQSAARVKTQ